MSVTSVSGAAPAVLPATVNRSSEPAASRGPSSAAVAVDPPTPEPPPLRFPWLSRLARELEPVSPQPSPYGRVELLGERLDKQA